MLIMGTYFLIYDKDIKGCCIIIFNDVLRGASVQTAASQPIESIAA